MQKTLEMTSTPVPQGMHCKYITCKINNIINKNTEKKKLKAIQISATYYKNTY